MVPPTSCAPRLRNAAATRQAMLASARRHFARESYETVGLREIAGDAGVDPALVSRYFGSKEQLFKEAVGGDDKDLLAGADRESLPAQLAAMLVDGQGKDPAFAEAKLERLLIMLRSASSPQASEIIREAVHEGMLEPMARLIGGDDAEMRASLTLALLMGSGILRSAMGMDALCECDDQLLRRHLTRLFEAALADAG